MESSVTACDKERQQNQEFAAHLNGYGKATGSKNKLRIPLSIPVIVEPQRTAEVRVLPIVSGEKAAILAKNRAEEHSTDALSAHNSLASW